TGRAERGDDPETLGGVVDQEADDEEGAEGNFPGGVRRADGQAFPEIVEPDGNGHQRGELERRALAARGRPMGPEARKNERSPDQAEKDEAVALKCAGNTPRSLERLGQRVNAEKNQQADGQCEEEVEPLAVQPSEKRKPEESEQHRNDAG